MAGLPKVSQGEVCKILVNLRLFEVFRVLKAVDLLPRHIFGPTFSSAPPPSSLHLLLLVLLLQRLAVVDEIVVETIVIVQIHGFKVNECW